MKFQHQVVLVEGYSEQGTKAGVCTRRQSPNASPQITSFQQWIPFLPFPDWREYKQSCLWDVNLCINKAWEPLRLLHSRSCQFLINFSRCRDPCQGAAPKSSSPIIYVLLIFLNDTGTGEIDGMVGKVLAAQARIPEFRSPDSIWKAGAVTHFWNPSVWGVGRKRRIPGQLV